MTDTNTPQFAIKKQILLNLSNDEYHKGTFTMPKDEDVEELYHEGCIDGEYREDFDFDSIYDFANDFRCSGDDVDLPCDSSRHYESKQVVAKLDSGQWVSWTYWYGGGKHGEPSAIDWMEDAYFVEYTEKTIVVKTFTKV